MKTFVIGFYRKNRAHFRQSRTFALSAGFAILAMLTNSAGSLPLQDVSSTVAPRIRSIATEGDFLVLVVQVPSGVKRVVIETCEDLARNEWRSIGSRWVNGQAGEIAITLSSQGGLGFLRARADDPSLLPLPPVFTKGKRPFLRGWWRKTFHGPCIPS
jgi:hypothetical protein